MKVVIVESPSKAKTINKYLGKDYTVLASYGHVRDLPSKDGSVDPNNHFKMNWAMEARSKKHVAEIKKALKGADTLLLATDPDREGEAISWHVKQVLEEDKSLKGIATKRIVFNEITPSAIKHAVDHPRPLDDGLIQAYLARRSLDYLVGFTLSPVLWRKLPGSRSAGRVQSVALRLITDREAEIERFIPQEYWSIIGHFTTTSQKVLEARLTHYEGKKLTKFDIATEAQALETIARIRTQNYKVDKVEKKQTKRHPAAPFTTSTLQQEAARKLRFGAKRTMQIAQKLYEGITIGGETVGLITYMRTDSTNIAQEALDATRTLIQKKYGNPYLPKAPRVFKSKSKNAQEAHEAVRPTDVTRLPESVKSALDADQFKLYELIWKRMMASQMESALFDQVSIDIASGDKQIAFRATGTTLVFDGFLKLYEEGQDEENQDEDHKNLPSVTEGAALPLKEVVPNQHFTQPPPRYTEASLVKKLEELGIGRPSTYASIMSTLLDRSYVRAEKQQLIPEALGRLVTTFLVEYFPKYLEYDFTAHLEDQLDNIAQGNENWEKALTDFWVDFKKAVDDTAPLRISDVIDYLNEALSAFLFPVTQEGVNPRKCPSCKDGELSLKLGKFGAFVGCSNYPECRHTYRLTTGSKTNQAPGEGEEDPQAASANQSFEPRTLGSDPETNLEITLRKGPYGFYIQWGDAPVTSAKGKKGKPKEKPKRASLPKGMTPDALTLEQALSLGALPKSLGTHPETGEEITLGQGRFGPYVKHQGAFTSIPKALDPLSLTKDEAVELIRNKKKKGES